MLKRIGKYIALSAVSMLTLSACQSDDTLSVAGNQDKTPIELTVGVVGENMYTPRVGTRNVITLDKDNNKAEPFAKDTPLYMVMKSDKETGTTITSLYTRTIGTAAKGETSTTATSSSVSFSGDYTRYWEDSYSRESKLSVYALCAPTGDTGIQNALQTWATVSSGTSQWATDNNSTTIKWPLNSASVADQSTGFIANQDLCFSNNISNYTIGTNTTDNRVKFSQDATTGKNKFGKGNMIFYHALTKITFKIAKGSGFGGTSDFQFTDGTKNIVLTDFNTTGTFNVADGEFTTANKTVVKKFATGTAESGYDYVLDAIILPGTDLNNTEAKKISFTIDHNEYYLTKKQLMDALANKKTDKTEVTALDENNKMRPGVHYIFTMTVGKTKIEDFSAKVIPWETVTTTAEVSNARVDISLLDNGDKKTGTPDFDLYRAADVSSTIDDAYESYHWTTGFAKSSSLSEKTENHGDYTAADWYWPDSKTFYHFRAVMPANHPVATEATNGDYVTLTAAADNFDVCWGAPFYPTSKLTYDVSTTSPKGFDGTGTSHQIYKAIGATKETIVMEMFHMMSDVTIQLTTSTGDDAVDLTDATVQLSMIHPSGQVKMGNGLVTPTGDPTNVNGTVSFENSVYQWHYGFVPQSLENVVLTITTTDNNKYVVNMKDVAVTDENVSKTNIANPYSSTGKIDRWYPNFKYTYTFNLAKTAIKDIKSTLKQWETVSASQEVWF